MDKFDKVMYLGGWAFAARVNVRTARLLAQLTGTAPEVTIRKWAREEVDAILAMEPERAIEDGHAMWSQGMIDAHAAALGLETLGWLEARK